MNAMEKLSKARSLLLLDHPWWGNLAMSLKFVPEPLFETAATEGNVIWYNPDYIDRLDLPKTIGLVAHEITHPAMGDLWRQGDRKPILWNMACDHVNNLILIDARFTLPDGALVNPGFRGMSKERVYQILEQQAGAGGGRPGDQPGGCGRQGGKTPGSGRPKKGQQGQGGQSPEQDKYRDPGKCGSFIQPQDPNQAKQGEIEWKTRVAAAQGMGDLPDSLRRIIKDEVLDPPLPWQVILRDLVQRTARNDYNWTRPNKKYLARGIVLPSLISDELPTVVIGDDTSGSTEGYQDKFAMQTSGILGAFQTHIIVLHSDARVNGVEEYDTQDLPIHLEPRGGGGTDFRPVFKWVEEKGITPACLIYLTDLEGRFPNDPPDYPVFWVSVNDKKAPWGVTIPMK